MEKNVYIWNSNNIWIDQKPVDDKYQLQPNETFDKVPDGLLAPIKRVGAQTGSWQGATPEEHEAYVKQQQALYLQQHPEADKPAGPTVAQQMISTLGQNQAETSAQLKKLTDQVKQSQQMIAMLGAQMAMADAKHNTTTTEGK